MWQDGKIKFKKKKKFKTLGFEGKSMDKKVYKLKMNSVLIDWFHYTQH